MQLYNVAKLVVAAGPSRALIDAWRKDSDNFVLQECGQGRKDVIPQKVLEEMINAGKFEVVRVMELVPQFVATHSLDGLIESLREAGLQVHVIGGGDLVRAMAAFDGPLCEHHREEAMRQGVYTTEEMAKFFEVPKELIDVPSIVRNGRFGKLSVHVNAADQIEPDALTFARDRLEACRKDLAQFEANISDNITRGQRMVHDHTELMAECHKLNERAAKAKDEIKRWEAVVAAL